MRTLTLQPAERAGQGELSMTEKSDKMLVPGL